MTKLGVVFRIFRNMEPLLMFRSSEYGRDLQTKFIVEQ